MAKKKVSFEELLGFKKMQEISLERVHPPRAPPKIIKDAWDKYDAPAAGEITISSEKSVGQTSSALLVDSPELADSQLGIDFSYLANNSSFQRAILEFIKKFIPGFENVNPRASKKETAKIFNKNVANMNNVMNEFKAKVARLRNNE